MRAGAVDQHNGGLLPNCKVIDEDLQPVTRQAQVNGEGGGDISYVLIWLHGAVLG
jgi:hypothetical protein